MAHNLYILSKTIYPNWLTVNIAHNLCLLGGTNGTIFADCHHCHQSVKIGKDNRAQMCLRLRLDVSHIENYNYVVGI